MTIFITVLVIIGIGLLISIYTTENKDARFVFGIILYICGVLVGGALCDFIDPSQPQAIDVYRGNTTLEINRTFRDSLLIKSDTVVIFNNKIK